MKNKVIVTACTLLAMATASAQNAYDAEKLLGNDLNGTARFVGMGGAMGALGGDISVMSSNPAGIGIFRSNDVSVSFGFNNTSTKSNFSGVSMNEDKTRASFDQNGFFLPLLNISEPTRPRLTSFALLRLKKKKNETGPATCNSPSFPWIPYYPSLRC